MKDKSLYELEQNSISKCIFDKVKKIDLIERKWLCVMFIITGNLNNKECVLVVKNKDI